MLSSLIDWHPLAQCGLRDGMIDAIEIHRGAHEQAGTLSADTSDMRSVVGKPYVKVLNPLESLAV